MGRVDLFIVTQAIQKIEDDEPDFKNNKTWKKLNKLRCEIEIEIAKQRQDYLINSYAGDRNEKYYKELKNCENLLQKNEKELNDL